MQFKKHFSSNLQNLSIKKTLIINHPTSNYQNSFQAIKSEIKGEKIQKYSPNQLQYSSNKQNIINNQENQNYLKHSRSNTFTQFNKITPTLTFNQIKKNNIQAIQANQINHQQPPFLIFQTDKINANAFGSRKNLRAEKLHFESSKNIHQSNYHSHSQSNKNIRLGSMVFGSLVKKDQSVQRQRSPLRQTKSIDRMSDLQTDRIESRGIQCANNDGQQAKYKIPRQQFSNQQTLFYCFNCAINLVKQNYPIEQLTHDDINKFKMRHSNYMSKSDFYSQDQGSRLSLTKPHQNEKIKIGQKVKCRIIMKLNRLKAVENNLENIDFFYNSLASYLEQQRLNDRQEILRMKKLKKSEPQNYQNLLNSSLGTIDYMMKNLQSVSYDFLREAEQLLQNQVSYPKMKINIQPLQGFQVKIDQFTTFFENNLKISLQQLYPDCDGIKAKHRKESKMKQHNECLTNRNHPLRFSFEQALQYSSKAPIYSEISMNPLEQQNQSQLDESIPAIQRRKNAFRNLFPEQGDDDFDSHENSKLSPVFKQF